MKMFRILKAIGVASLMIVASMVANAKPNVLWYDRDAGDSFTDALPIGNGYMGGLIYGGVATDIIGLNESTVWNGAPGDNNKAGAANYLNDARSALFSGNYAAAEGIVNDHMIGWGPAAFQPVGNLEIKTPHSIYGSYYRELDLSTAIAKTRYVCDGVEYTREYFASYPDHIIVVRLSASQQGKVTFNATLTTPHRNNYLHEEGRTLVHDVTVDAIKFQNRMEVITDGGTASLSDNKIHVDGANSAVLILTTGTNFVSFDNVTANPGERATAIMNKVQGKSYEDILADI